MAAARQDQLLLSLTPVLYFHFVIFFFPFFPFLYFLLLYSFCYLTILSISCLLSFAFFFYFLSLSPFFKILFSFLLHATDILLFFPIHLLVNHPSSIFLSLLHFLAFTFLPSLYAVCVIFPFPSLFLASPCLSLCPLLISAFPALFNLHIFFLPPPPVSASLPIHFQHLLFLSPFFVYFHLYLRLRSPYFQCSSEFSLYKSFCLSLPILLSLSPPPFGLSSPAFHCIPSSNSSFLGWLPGFFTQYSLTSWFL